MAETLKARILAVLGEQGGLTDRELTDRVLGSTVGQQAVNQACRQLEADGLLVRSKAQGGRIQNALADVRPLPVSTLAESPEDPLSEDNVKRALLRWLEGEGWGVVSVAMGRERGIDIEARRGDRRWIIEAKGIGSSDPMRVNYFLGVLGETLQRMSDPDARYSVAFPDLRQFVRLWARLPALAKARTGITALFVDAGGHVRHEDLPPQ